MSVRVDAQDTLVAFGSDGWDYFVGSVAPSEPIEAWKAPGFALPALPEPLPDPLVGVWLEDAIAPIGYGSAAKNIPTTIPSSAAGGYSTLYCRRTFDVVDPSVITELTLDTQHDDGFVLYFNGIEVARHNVGAGDEADHATFANGSHEYTAEPNSFDITPSVGELVAGSNTLAIEIKNINDTSSDLLIDLEIIASDDLDALCPTSASCSRQPDGTRVSWTNDPVATYDSIAVARDGVPLAGSPFDGDTEVIVDEDDGGTAHCYEIVAAIDGAPCDSIECCTTSQVSLVDVGDSWLFFRGNEEPSPDPDDASPTLAWTDPAFDDSAWELGASGFGYGDGDDTTVLDDMEDTYSSVYLRTDFVVAVADVEILALEIDYDDGFVAYLNGVEVARSNIADTGTVQAFDDLADGNHEAGASETFLLDVAALEDGENTLAILGLNTTLGSSDFSLIPRLTTGGLICPDPADVACVYTRGGVQVSWVNDLEGNHDAITVTRNGVEIAGSPFSSDTESVLDADAPAPSVDNPLIYEVTHAKGADTCDLLTCTLTDATITICPEGDDWSFFRGTEEPSPDGGGLATLGWAQPDFDDGAWEVGPSGFGYGDGDDNTALDDMQPQVDDPDTPDVDESSSGYLTVYVRKTLSVANLADVSGLALSIDYDDGFIAYFNGVEFARATVPGDEIIAHDSAADGNHESGDAEIFGVPANLIAVGDNVIAIMGVNVGLTSSDFSLIPELVTGLEIPISGFACVGDPVAGSVTVSWNVSTHDEYVVTRNGVDLPGSPFPAGTTSVVDASPDAADNLYEIVGVSGGQAGATSACAVDCGELFPDVLTCVLGLADDGQSTAAQLDWTIDPPGTSTIDVLREGEVVESLAAGVRTFSDPDVESLGPRDETTYEVRFLGADGGELCVVTCAGLSLCPEDLTCTEVAGSVELVWDNVVKEWESFTVLRDGVEIASGLGGESTSFTDDSVDLAPGVAVTYTLQPIAPDGEQAPCDRNCSFVLPVAELARFLAPDGGWDYSIDFGPESDQYNVNPLEAGNLDGSWIRAANDMWDGSAPLDVGAAPDGERPGGIGVETLAGLGACDDPASVLRLLDPGDPGDPGGSLSTEHPDSYNVPDNSMFLLGYDTDVTDANLLRDGVTIAGRFRINPESPGYLAAGEFGDGSPITDGIGQLGVYFVDDGSLGTEGVPAGLSVDLNSGDFLQMSTAPQEQLGNTVATVFRSFWATVEDPEGDDSYNVRFYLNGDSSEFALFGNFDDVGLQAGTPDFGAAVGNFLAISMPSGGNDGDIQIDWFAYKAGVHLPNTVECAPCENNVPTAAITVDPGTSVNMTGASVDATLDGTGSDDGDGGTQGLSYTWSRVSGPASVTLASASQDTTTATFVEVGVYTFRLAVSDGQDCSSTDTAFVTITVSADCPNTAPTAAIVVAEGPTVNLIGASVGVTLDGGDSDDGDGGAQELSYSWLKVVGPPGDTIADAAAQSTTVTFTAGGSYRYRLTVDDGQDCDSEATATVTITVTTDCPNTAPTADIAVVGGTTVNLFGPSVEVTLDGGGSDDGDGGAQVLSYIWTKLEGPPGDTIADEAAQSTAVTFTAGGSYGYQLTVDDGQPCDSAATATVTITVTTDCPNTAPTADIVVAGGTTVILVGASVEATLDGGGSDDGDGGAQVLSYGWLKLVGPPGDTIADAAAQSTTVTFTAAGSYLYQLAVDDGQACDSAATATVTITVTTDCPNTPPNASATADPDVSVILDGASVEVTLDGGGSDDGDGGAQGLSYSWLKLTGPPGDTIADAAAQSTTVTFTAIGSYSYQLTVDDGQACNSSASVAISVIVTEAGGGPLLVRGDSNSSGIIDLTDGVLTLNYLFTGGVAPECVDAADSDGNGRLVISDAVIVFRYLFSGGAPPLSPSPSATNYSPDDCGEDPDDDPFGCLTPSAKCNP